jgi:predicted branched-subunit amino acid permease
MPLPPEPPGDLTPHGRLGRWVAGRVEAFAHTARHPLFWVGAREMSGISVGMTVWSFMTGVAMVKSGMSVTEAVLMSLLVFAGSAQLAAIPLIAAGAPLWVILATAFCVNLRFVVFSLHLRDYFMFLPRSRRLWLGYFTGDVTYVLFTRRFPKPAETERQRRAQMAYLWGGNCCNWVFWQSFGFAGIFLGAALPQRWGLEFAGTLALLAVTCSLATTRMRALSALMAAAAAVVLFALPYRLNIVAAIVVAVAICLALEPMRRPPPPPAGRKDDDAPAGAGPAVSSPAPGAAHAGGAHA